MNRNRLVFILLISACGIVFSGWWKYIHGFRHQVADIPADPTAGYTTGCNSVISAVEATGGHPDGTQFVLTSMADESVPIWNQRLGVVCRPSVSIISATVAKAYGGNHPVLFGALPIQDWRFHQWQVQHPPKQYVDQNGAPILTPLPDVSDAENLLAAEDHLTHLKNAKHIGKKDLDELQMNFIDESSKKALLLELTEGNVQAIELDLLIKARDAGVPIDDWNLTAWAKGRIKQFQDILRRPNPPGWNEKQ